MTTEKKITVSKDKVGRVQYLTDILSEIPPNTILYKKLTGLGATYSELKAKRNSIIIEPNIPVIIGKCNSEKHKEDNLLGVYEGVYTPEIIKYLERSKNKYYKILTTPESFRKVKDAFDEIDISIYHNCFLLFDECHKIVKDVDYRIGITLPMDDFFLFTEKALVSATPVELSDPRFIKQDFHTIEIVPDFDYTIDIKIFHTNNTLQSIKYILSSIKPEETEKPIYIFMNSIDIIYSLMKQLDIINESTVFCAPKSIEKLRQNNFRNAFGNWQRDKISKYNFFTSRFFTAVDIELEEKPHVILVTDLYYAEHTMLDPHTDVIQIIGRFRNGISSVTHLTNSNKDLPYRTREELKGYIHCSEEIYNIIKNFYDNATTKAARDAFRSAMESLPFNSMLDKDGIKNWFAIDNYIDEEYIKNYYRSKYTIRDAYKNSDYFNPSMVFKWYKIGDEERLKRENKSISLKEKRKIIVEQLEMIGTATTEMEWEYKRELIAADSFIVDAYDILGKEIIAQLKYSSKKIKEAMILKQYNEKAQGAEVIQLIKNSFKVGEKYTAKYIKEELKRIYELIGINPPKRITAKTIGNFFIIAECQIKKERGYMIIDKKI